MKAILVVDIEEIENCDAEVCVYKNDIPYQGFSRIKLKPMPQYMTMKNVVSCDYNEAFVNGFNTCIDEILGEEE